MIEVSRHTLSNGLRIIHSYDPSTVMVAVNVMYNVGARDESAERTGMAHLFEHLMFGGSVNVPAFDREVEVAGGMSNAWTSNDFTNFYIVLPAVNAETAFWLESDRMLSPAFTERSLDVQKGVVIEEFKQTCLNRPYGDMAHHLRRMAFDSHPYSWPTIGLKPEHIRDVTLDDVKGFFFSHYAPNNAVLAVCGNITADETVRLAEKWFGSIPSRSIAPRSYRRLGEVDSPRYAEAYGNVPQTALTVAFRMPGYGESGYVECDQITDILASGHASRFYRNIMMADPLFTSADASILGSDEPGLLMLNARLTSDKDADIARATDRLIGEASKIWREGVTDDELSRAHTRYESQHTFSMLSYLGKAQLLAQTEMQHDDINTLVGQYNAVTPERLCDVASSVIVPDKAMRLVYRPKPSEA